MVFGSLNCHNKIGDKMTSKNGKSVAINYVFKNEYNNLKTEILICKNDIYIYHFNNNKCIFGDKLTSLTDVLTCIKLMKSIGYTYAHVNNH